MFEFRNEHHEMLTQNNRDKRIAKSLIALLHGLKVAVIHLLCTFLAPYCIRRAKDSPSHIAAPLIVQSRQSHSYCTTSSNLIRRRCAALPPVQFGVMKFESKICGLVAATLEHGADGCE